MKTTHTMTLMTIISIATMGLTSNGCASDSSNKEDNALLTVSGQPVPDCIARALRSDDQLHPEDHCTQDEAGDDHGNHAEPGDDHGNHAEPGDDHGNHAEPGDDHGNHAEPGDDHGNHARPKTTVQLAPDQAFNTSRLFDDSLAKPADINKVIMSGDTQWRARELNDDRTFTVGTDDCAHNGNRGRGRDRIFIEWQNHDGTREIESVELTYCAQ